MEDAGRLISEVQEIVSALVDDRATEDQVRRLEQLVAESVEARHTYVRCMALHVDLHHLLSRRQVKVPPLSDAPTPVPIVAYPPTRTFFETLLDPEGEPRLGVELSREGIVLAAERAARARVEVRAPNVRVR